ncbi:MAG: hypothetical protein ACKO1M_15465 [Planctomycetota bacterium]
MTSDPNPTTSFATGKLSLRGRGQQHQTPTADIAATALDYVLQRRASRRTGGPVGPIPDSLRRQSTGAAGSGPPSARSPLRARARSAAVLAAVISLIAFALVYRGEAGPQVERHAVHGTLTLRGRPLADSVVEFHRLDAAGVSIETAFTDSRGHFVIGDTAGTGVPSGEYGVVVRGRRRVVRRGEVFFDHVPLPPQYAKPDASPLKASVSGPVARLSLAISP